jgi:bacillithiol system protein YtxJ
VTTLDTGAAFDAFAAGPGAAWVLKHSRTCPVSSFAFAEVREYAEAHPEDPVGLVVVQDHRPVSEHAAAATGVRHESPQILLFVDGALRWHASHGAITRAAMEGERRRAGRTDSAPGPGSSRSGNP